MLLASETSIQLTNALEKLIDSGIQLGERVLGALIIFIIGKFLVNWLNRLFARILEKRKCDRAEKPCLSIALNCLFKNFKNNTNTEHRYVFIDIQPMFCRDTGTIRIDTLSGQALGYAGHSPRHRACMASCL